MRRPFQPAAVFVTAASQTSREALDKPKPSPYKPATADALARSGAQVAQLVEHATENRSVGGSIPPLGTI